jgi:hypothetical protein
VVSIRNRTFELGGAPSFHAHVNPKIPRRIGKAYYVLATAHAVLGTLVEISALYVLLAAGTTVLPPKLRMTDYKVMDAQRAGALVARVPVEISDIHPLVRPALVFKIASRRFR